MPENPEKSLNSQGVNENEKVDFWAGVKQRLEGRTTESSYRWEIIRKGGQQCSVCGFTYPANLIKRRDGAWYCNITCSKVNVGPR